MFAGVFGFSRTKSQNCCCYAYCCVMMMLDVVWYPLVYFYSNVLATIIIDVCAADQDDVIDLIL